MTRVRKVSAGHVRPDRRRGGELRPLLTPGTAGATSGFMGVATVDPGDAVREHYHPYSEEFLYVVSGEALIRVDGEPIGMRPGDALLLPRHTRHRLENHGAEPVRVVFHLSPLAPEPAMGHVDTEPAAGRPR
jgi:putative monooxygenase